MKYKECPNCKGEFLKSKRVPVGDITSNVCPHCLTPLFYRKEKGNVTVVLLEDKLCVDDVLRILNGRIGAEDKEATIRERKFAYDLLDFIKKFLGCQSKDVGMTPHEFTRELVRHVLNKEWWSEHMKSLLMMRNNRSRFAIELYDYLITEREVYEKRTEQLQRKLTQLRQQILRA